MSEYFRFNAAEYEFGLLQQSIEKYYSLNPAPVDKQDNITEDTCRDYEVIGEITYDNVGVAKNYKARWKPFVRFLRQQMKKPVNGTIYLTQPCFQGYLTVEEISGQHYKLTKELHFAVSLLAPYYTIYGLDESVRMLRTDVSSQDIEADAYGYYRATHAVTVSPCFEYESHFSLLKNSIATWFPEHRFVPFAINKMRMPGLRAPQSEIDGKDSDRIYSALFNDNLDFAVPVRGDAYYGYDEWRIPETLTAEDYANKEIIAEHIEQNRQGTTTHLITIHKVWKYKSAERLLPFVQANAIGMMSIETFELLDLIDLHTVRYIVPPKAKVQCSAYEIIEEELLIQAQPHSKFRIANVAATELRLVLIYDFTTDGRRIQGEACELLFGAPE